MYSFDQDAIKSARHSKDLLVTLPELKHDPLSNKIASIKGGTVLFLINGIEASDAQLQSVQPENVVKVEYFDIVPTRWEGRAETLVNVITRNPEQGLSYGADVFGAFSTGFLNATAYFSHTRGKHDFGLEYVISLRDYNNRRYDNTYEYLLHGDRYKSTKVLRDHFGYTYQDAAFRYTFVPSDKQTFQAKLIFNRMDAFSKGNGDNTFEQGSISTQDKIYDYSSQHNLKPTLDLYYSNKLSKKDELIFNLVGSTYNNKTYQDQREWVASTGVDIFNNRMYLTTNQSAFVGEVVHHHSFQKMKLSSGYKVANNHISNDLSNLAGDSEYSVNYFSQYFHTELSGWLGKKFAYRLGAGLMHIHNRSEKETFNDWTFTPRLVLHYKLNAHKSLRFNSSIFPGSPSSAQLSSNVINVVPNIIKTGNPYLKSKTTWRNSLTYSYNSKYLDVNASLSHIFINNAIEQMYIYDARFNSYALTYQNADYHQILSGEISGAIKPLGSKLLTIKTALKPTSESILLANGNKKTNEFIGNTFTLSSQYKNFFLNYEFNIPIYSIGGAFLNTNENQNHLILGYSHRNWMFKAALLFIGTPSEYKTKSQEGSLVDYMGHTRIFNNKNMLSFGISYNFSRGKKTDIDKKVENETPESANF